MLIWLRVHMRRNVGFVARRLTHTHTHTHIYIYIYIYRYLYRNIAAVQTFFLKRICCRKHLFCKMNRVAAILVLVCVLALTVNAQIFRGARPFPFLLQRFQPSNCRCVPVNRFLFNCYPPYSRRLTCGPPGRYKVCCPGPPPL